MLEEQQAALGAQHARHLGEGGRGIRDRAEDERADHGVEALIGEGQALGGRLDDLRRARGARQVVSQPAGHVLRGLGDYELGDGRRVVLEVQAGPGADLQRRTGRAGQQSRRRSANPACSVPRIMDS